MHKDFYASGFIYHPKTQQILLQQVNLENETPAWSLLSEKGSTNKTGEEIFKEMSFSKFKIELKIKNIHLIYTYFSDETKRNHNIYYAEVNKITKPSLNQKNTFGWFTFKQITKLNLLNQAKHDIVIGQRVIQSSVRKTLGERTIDE